MIGKIWSARAWRFAFLLAAAILLVGPMQKAAAAPASEVAPVTQASATPRDKTRDVVLYRDIVTRMENGESYYEAATALHRARNYPLQPFFTVRPPVLAWLTMAAGTTGLYLLVAALVLASLLVWLRRDPAAPLPEKALVAGLMALGGSAMVGPAQVAMHETWCGLLLTLALGLYLGGHWWAALVAAACALAFREFALPFVALMGAIALLQRQWWQVLGALIVGVAFAALMAMHARAVAAHRLAGDLPSPPWQGMRGLSGLTQDIAQLSALQFVPFWLAAVLVALAFLGWASLARGGWRGFLPIAWFAGFGAVIALFARENNFYWAQVMQPAFLVGLAFLPRMLSWRGQDVRNRLTNAP